MKQKYFGVIFTNHVVNRLYNRGISQSQAYEVFKYPDGSLPGKTPGSKRFYKKYGGKKVEIVAKKNEKGEWIILTGWIRCPHDANPRVAPKELFLQRLVDSLLGKILNRNS